jgi:hypothetical protein
MPAGNELFYLYKLFPNTLKALNVFGELVENIFAHMEHMLKKSCRIPLIRQNA